MNNLLSLTSAILLSRNVFYGIALFAITDNLESFFFENVTEE